VSAHVTALFYRIYILQQKVIVNFVISYCGSLSLIAMTWDFITMYFSLFRHYYNVILTFLIKLSLKIVNIDLDVHGYLDWHSLVIYYYIHRISCKNYCSGLYAVQ
jgi:hypothetical protein